MFMNPFPSNLLFCGIEKGIKYFTFLIRFKIDIMSLLELSIKFRNFSCQIKYLNVNLGNSK